MRKKIEWQWEKLDDATWRAKVIGGWLVKSEYCLGKTPATTMAYVIDRDHEWHVIPPLAPEVATEKEKFPG